MCLFPNIHKICLPLQFAQYKYQIPVCQLHKVTLQVNTLISLMRSLSLFLPWDHLSMTQNILPRIPTRYVCRLSSPPFLPQYHPSRYPTLLIMIQAMHCQPSFLTLSHLYRAQRCLSISSGGQVVQ